MFWGQYAYCRDEVKNYTELDKYLWDLTNSDIWEDPEGVTLPLDLLSERLKALNRIWDACNLSVKDIALVYGAKSLAKRFGVPCRTMEDWCANKRNCPLYTRLMMQECLNYYSPPLGVEGLLKKYYIECHYAQIEGEDPIESTRSQLFDSKEEAFESADLQWASLPEQAKREIEVFVVNVAAWDGFEYEPFWEPIRIYKMFGEEKEIPKDQEYESSRGEAEDQSIESILSEDEKSGLFSSSIEVLGLSTRTYNCLIRGEIRTVGAILKNSSKELLRIRNFGKECLLEIRKELANLGLALKGESVATCGCQTPSQAVCRENITQCLHLQNPPSVNPSVILEKERYNSWLQKNGLSQDAEVSVELTDEDIALVEGEKKSVTESDILKLDYPKNLLYAIAAFRKDNLRNAIDLKVIEYALSKLTERQRYIFTERYRKKRTYRSIGEDLGISPSGVEQHIRKGLRKIRERVSIEYVEPGCSFMEMRVDDVFRFSARTTNALFRSGIVTVDDLVNKTPKEIRKIRNIGTESLSEIESGLAKYNLTLAFVSNAEKSVD